MPIKYWFISKAGFAALSPYATEYCRQVEPQLHHIGSRKVKCHTPLNEQGNPVEYQGA